MGMIQPSRFLFILAADYLFQSIVSVLGLLLHVKCLQTTTTNHLYIFRHFTGH